MPTTAPISRDVVSFVRRSPRMNPSQQRAWKANSAWIVDLPRGQRETSIAPGAHLDWDALFGRSAPLHVEIGSGTGDAVTAAALARPDANHVAIEVFTPAIAEVAEVFEVPLDFLLDSGNHTEASVEWQGRNRHYYEIHWDGHRIWGATAAMIVNLSRRLRWNG